MQYSEDTLKKIKSFGALQYDVERIISILRPENPHQLRADLKDPDSIVFVMYQSGFDAGKYRLDAQQFRLAEAEADIKKLEYEEKKQQIALRKQLFGI